MKEINCDVCGYQTKKYVLVELREPDEVDDEHYFMTSVKCCPTCLPQSGKVLHEEWKQIKRLQRR